jgi:hypothetical protein
LSEGPKEGGILEAPSPGVAKGLIRIDKKGNYIYQVELPEPKNQWRFSVGRWSPPKISGERRLNFRSMYGDSDLVSLFGSYDYLLFNRAGSVFLVVGGGFSSVEGTGTLSDGTLAFEQYTLWMLPVSLGLSYEMDFLSKYFTPLFEVGGSYTGLLESRDDGRSMNTAGAWSSVIGGGIKFSMTSIDRQAAITLANRYGIRGLWILIQGQARQGLSQDLDFTSSYYGIGFAFGL